MRAACQRWRSSFNCHRDDTAAHRQFQTVLTAVQFSIQLGSFATVVGLIVLRIRQPHLPRPYRCWGYPVTPLLFLAISLWMMILSRCSKPWETLAGMALILLGWIVYFVSPKNDEGMLKSTSPSS
jgi:APA family basic amino acid/polyamine antiporter